MSRLNNVEAYTGCSRFDRGMPAQGWSYSASLDSLLEKWGNWTMPTSGVIRCAVVVLIATVTCLPTIAFAQESNPNVELFKRAKAGEVGAQEQVARKYLYGDGTKQDATKARYWFEQAANGGNNAARIELGKMLAIGVSVPLDAPESIVWFRQAADDGDAEGMFWLAHSYQIGSGTTADPSAAADWYARAAEKGHAGAAYNLAVMSIAGNGVPANLATGVAFLTRAATLGDTRAMRDLGNRYARGNGVQRNIPEAVRWLKPAAEAGDAGAQHDLGAMHYYGHGIARDRGEAARWLHRAATQNFVPSQAVLGTLYLTAEPPDYNQAKVWLGKAADAGNADAQCSLGAMYEKGSGVAVDEHYAFELYHKAAQTGHLNACYAIGGMICDGRGGYDRNDDLALQWLRMVADKSPDPLDENQRVTIAASQLVIGTIYDNVAGYNNVPKQPDVAIDWYRRAAENGSLDAQRLYGQRLRDRGHYPEAMSWLRKAAEKGDRPAQNDLGTMYYNGQGVAASRTDAIAWWLKAYRQGSTTARDSLRKIGVNAP